MNMKRIKKALLLLCCLFLAVAFPAVDMQAQGVNSGFEGTWVLDSVQVKEVMPDSIIQKTVLPGGDSKFSQSWMLQFTLNAGGKASYTEAGNRTISNVSYTIEERNGNNATIIIDGVPDYKILNTQLLSNNTLLFTVSFSTGYNLKDIDVSWEMYYHKSN